MCVQSLNLIFLAVFVLELVMCPPPRNVSIAKFLWPWKLQHQIPFKHIFWSNCHLSNFFGESLTSNKSILERKSKYLNSIRVFPFFISFSCWNEINKKSSLKEDTRRMKNCKVNQISDRSSDQRCSVRKDVFRHFAKFTGKHRAGVSFLIKLQT